MEKLIEGIQDYEKARILLARWTEEGNQEKLAALRQALDMFTFEEIKANGPEAAIRNAKSIMADQL